MGFLKVYKFWIFTAILIVALFGLSLLGNGGHFHEIWQKYQRDQRLYQHSVEIGEHRRWFDYVMPDTLDRESVPLIFVIHYSGGSANAIRREWDYHFDDLMNLQGGIVVYPSGFDNHWNDCRKSASYQANQQKIDDIGFFTEMVDFFQKKYGVDSNRVYAVGVSNGGHMVYRLALELPQLFAGLAAMVASMPVDENSECKPSGEFVPIAIFNGTRDRLNPFEGGVVKVGEDISRGEVMSSLDSGAYWAALAGMTNEYQKVELPQADLLPHNSVILHSWGVGNQQVRLYELVGSGHVVAKKNVNYEQLTGYEASDIEASNEIWKFFEQVTQ